MFTKNVNTNTVSRPPRRGPGRPPGPTAQGIEARRRLYDTAITLITERGYEGTTLRDIADAAGVSVGLLYRYFPSKRSVVLALYDELSATYAQQAASMAPGRWRDRFMFALRTSLQVLGRHRRSLSALVPVLIGDPDEGLFAPSTTFSRRRVQAVFHNAISGANDAPKDELAGPLGRLLYLVHLGVLLWWLLDKSPRQRATDGLVALLERAMPSLALALRLSPVRSIVRSGDALFRDALFDDTQDA
jgi:AcrR family transcriptional regulator